MLFQLAILFFAAVVILRTYAQYRREIVSRYWLLAFSAAWAMIVFVAFVPRATDVVAQAVGVERGADMLVYIAILCLLYAVYRLFAHVQMLEREITELVRQLALERPKVPSEGLRREK